MKRITMALAATIMMSTAALAQNAQGNQPERRFDKTEMVKRQTERMVSEYGLNKEQADKLLQLNTSYADKLPRMRGQRGGRRGGPRPEAGQRNRPDGNTGATQQANPDQQQRQRPSREQMEERMKEMRANMEAYNGELKQIMTDEQFAKYEANMKQRQERMQRPQGNRGGQRGGQRNRD